MEAKSSKIKGEINCDDTECEIDILSCTNGQKVSKNDGALAGVKSEARDNDINSKQFSGSKQTECTSNMTVDIELFEDNKHQVKDDKDKLSIENCFQKVEFNSLDEGVPDETDVYKRFYFESDHLALKDNADYRLLLQTFIALEAQRKQAIQDYEKLIRLRKEALAEPVKFVEKLQNNEPLNIPSRQNVLKVPQINWEAYSGAIEDFSQFGLLHQHNTRHSAGTAAQLERANQRWEDQSTASNGSYGEGSQESIRFTPSMDNCRYVRGKLATSDKPVTFNQPWTTEEQRKLERLLQVFPQEPVEAKRWSKIAHALGNRTPKQVASRVQKYFIKLARSGLPIPGREPNLNKVLSKQVPTKSRTNIQQQAVSFHNSTFFPSYKPRVYMEDNENSDCLSDDLADVSDDESIPTELRNTKEYWEILQLKKLKRKRSQKHLNAAPTEPCDSAGATDWTTSGFVDGDYAKLGGEASKEYNYLDPNFLPATT